MYPTNVNIGVVDYIHFNNDVSQFNLNVLTRLSFLCLLCVFYDCTTSSHYYDFFLYILFKTCYLFNYSSSLSNDCNIITYDCTACNEEFDKFLILYMHLMLKEQFKKQFMSIFERIIMLTEKIQTDCLFVLIFILFQFCQISVKSNNNQVN